MPGLSDIKRSDRIPNFGRNTAALAAQATDRKLCSCGFDAGTRRFEVTAVSPALVQVMAYRAHDSHLNGLAATSATVAILCFFIPRRQGSERMSLERRLFPANALHAPLLRTLLALDGSTTRVCEALAQQPVQVLLHHQQQTCEVPDAVHRQLGGSSWLARIASLHAEGCVLMDNLSYIRLDAVPDTFLHGLTEGRAPIGRLLQTLFVQRKAAASSAQIEHTLWQCVGLVDGRASRTYRIVTAEGPLMLIFEVFRGGLVQGLNP
jgi:chorismate-pyruvate lyase